MVLKSRKYLILSLVTLAVLIAALMIWQQSSNLKNNKFSKPRVTEYGKGLFLKNNSLLNIPIKGPRVDSIVAAEKQIGRPLKVPERLFGKKAQVFVSEGVAPNGNRFGSVVYSNAAVPTNSDPAINIGWRDPGLASPEQTVAQGLKDGKPFSLRNHKNHPGFTIEKSSNKIGDNVEPTHPVVFWMSDDNITYTVYGPLGMDLNELLSITDSID